MFGSFKNKDNCVIVVNPVTYTLKAQKIFLVELREGRANNNVDGSKGEAASKNFSTNRSVFRAGKRKSVLVLFVCRRRYILRVTKYTFERQRIF